MDTSESRRGKEENGITYNSISEILELLLWVKFLMGKDVWVHRPCKRQRQLGNLRKMYS